MLTCHAHTRKHSTPMNTKPSAWLGRRFAAMLYDLFILIALWMATSALCIALTGGHMDVTHPPWWQQIALLAVSAAYFVCSWIRGGQTIGMRAWRLKLNTADGAPLRAAVALTRFFLASLSLLLLGIGFWWALLDSRKLTAHDRICDTQVCKLA